MISQGNSISVSIVYEASRVAKANAGLLFRAYGYNSKASAQYIQVHDAAALPADTAVPGILIKVAAESHFSIDLGDAGEYFGKGIVICNSSTGPTKTIGAADCWFRVIYR